MHCAATVGIRESLPHSTSIAVSLSFWACWCHEMNFAIPSPADENLPRNRPMPCVQNHTKANRFTICICRCENTQAWSCQPVSALG